MTAAKEAGLKVFRTWGFNDKNVTFDPAGLPQYGGEGAGATSTVFQWWSNGTSKIDVSGFDRVVDAATKVGMKLVVTLTNNWADYGGMDVYTTNLGYKYHDDVGRSSVIPRLFSARGLFRNAESLKQTIPSSTPPPPSNPPLSATLPPWSPATATPRP